MHKLFKWLFKGFLFFILLGVLLYGFIVYSGNYYKLREYLNQNTMEIMIEDNLEPEKVNVYWSGAIKEGQLIKNGKETDFVYKEYGKNNFIITYNRDTIKVFGYFKYNNWHGHKHVISLSKKIDESIEAKVQISGPDENRIIE